MKPVALEMPAEALEVVMRSGHVIRVRPRFDETTLVRLVAVLGGA